MAKKGEKNALLARINAKLAKADLPPIPADVIYGMPLIDLVRFDDRWVSPVVGTLIARKAGIKV